MSLHRLPTARVDWSLEDLVQSIDAMLQNSLNANPAAYLLADSGTHLGTAISAYTDLPVSQNQKSLSEIIISVRATEPRHSREHKISQVAQPSPQRRQTARLEPESPVTSVAARYAPPPQRPPSRSVTSSSELVVPSPGSPHCPNKCPLLGYSPRASPEAAVCPVLLVPRRPPRPAFSVWSCVRPKCPLLRLKVVVTRPALWGLRFAGPNVIERTPPHSGRCTGRNSPGPPRTIDWRSCLRRERFVA
ncbi:hypothetical protein GQ600_970 [Phytophthora cactorum]|nr:hypothetical protein GQ600_970 [Phytophthora cactorum]